MANTGADALEMLERALSALVERTLSEPVKSVVGTQDLPAQRRLEALCRALTAVAPADRPRTEKARRVARQALKPLEAWLWDECVALVLVDLPVGPPALAPLRELVVAEPRPFAGLVVRASVVSWAQDRSRECAVADVLGLVDGLTQGAERWAALGLVEAGLVRFGAGPELRERLAGLRIDPVTAAFARRTMLP